MKYINRVLFKTSLLLLALIPFQGCETLDVNVVDSPNAVNPSSADSDLYINAIQLRLTDFITGKEGSNFDGMSEFGMEAWSKNLRNFRNTRGSKSQPDN